MSVDNAGKNTLLPLFMEFCVTFIQLFCFFERLEKICGMILIQSQTQSKTIRTIFQIFYIACLIKNSLYWEIEKTAKIDFS